MRERSRVLIVCLIIITLFAAGSLKSHKKKSHYNYDKKRTNAPTPTKISCMDVANTLKARHKTCFLRPDTGPCRADITQWYFDAKQKRCYRFFWGGCQGNGNRYDTVKQCLDYCYLNSTNQLSTIPYFCSLAFDYGSCFGQYYRWGWDSFGKTCKRRLYSGCGGNQNNFETEAECMRSCLKPPDNALSRKSKQKRQTTCISFDINSIQ